ncbi:MAG: DUF4990 domain-containing protein, partial [Bacteroidales bacterium]|nr:DUF4990 domain-containing protein [Bacteroidales bacterium]
MAQPWQTWGWAFDHATAGDTVFFRGGVYYSSASNIGGERGFDSGTADNWTYFLNYPGETPILDCSLRNAMTYNGYNRGIYIRGVDYIHIKGLQIRNVYQGEYLVDAYGVNISGCGNIILENMVVHDVAGVAYSIEGYHETIEVINCDAYNMCDSLKTAVYPEPGSPGQNGVGFSFNNNGGSDNAILRYSGCRTWNFSDNGFAGSGAGYVEWDHCWAFNGGALSGDGVGFKTQSGYGVTPALDTARVLKYCIGAMNAVCGFTPNNNGDPVFNLRQYNCVAYHNGYKEGIGHGPSSGLAIMNYYLSTPAVNEMYANNIFYANEDYEVYAYDPYIHSHNSVDTPPGVTVTNEDFLSTDWTEMMMPRQPDGSLPDINFLRLAPGSDLIDAGIDVGLPFNGASPDLGCYESYSSTSPPAVPVYSSSVVQNAYPAWLVMIYNITLANIIPATYAFTVMVNSSPRGVSSVVISGQRVLLTLSSPVV